MTGVTVPTSGSAVRPLTANTPVKSASPIPAGQTAPAVSSSVPAPVTRGRCVVFPFQVERRRRGVTANAVASGAFISTRMYSQPPSSLKRTSIGCHPAASHTLPSPAASLVPAATFTTRFVPSSVSRPASSA